MTNPSRRPKARNPPGRPGALRPGSAALVLSDGKPIRDKVKKDYDTSQADLRRAREDWDTYHLKDLPSFNQWFHRAFGALLTRMRECQRQLSEAEFLVWELHAECMRSGCSPAVAYRRVMRRREEPPPASGGAREQEDTSATGAGPRGRDRFRDELLDEIEREFKDIFNDVFGEIFDEDFGIGREKRGRRGGKRAPKSRGPESSRPRQLKGLYRKLARRLHPDLHRELSGQRLEWWHQVQAAYASGDAEQLEIILALCEIDDAGHTNSTSLSVLQRITRQLKKALRDLKSQLRRLHGEPAWRFTKRTDLAAFKTKLGIQLESELSMIQAQLKEHQRYIDALKRQAERPERKRRNSGRPRRPRAEPMEF